MTASLPLTLVPPPSTSSRRLPRHAGPQRKPPPSSTPTATSGPPMAAPTSKQPIGKRSSMPSVPSAPTLSPLPKPSSSVATKWNLTEIQRLRSLPLPRLINNSTTPSPSSWVHFKSMDLMEEGPNKPHTDTTTATNPNTPTNNLNFPDEFQLNL
ncbi:hypothetical protein V8G54_001793 [Vigna mungo]|uniref:Uncharacterized protein n=1 Tax=Vigna mungo TaxID=3915 RepID=A0AAQ3P8G7_VIGMU